MKLIQYKPHHKYVSPFDCGKCVRLFHSCALARRLIRSLSKANCFDRQNTREYKGEKHDFTINLVGSGFFGRLSCKGNYARRRRRRFGSNDDLGHCRCRHWRSYRDCCWLSDGQQLQQHRRLDPELHLIDHRCDSRSGDLSAGYWSQGHLELHHGGKKQEDRPFNEGRSSFEFRISKYFMLHASKIGACR